MNFWQNLSQSQWITPTIILSVGIYFIHLLGKIIADQKSFADDRNWEIEFSGLWFFTNLILPTGIIAIALLIYFRGPIMDGLAWIPANFSPITYHWIDLIIVFIFGLYYAVAGSILSEGRYKITALVARTAWGGSGIPEDKRDRIFNRIMDINAALMQPSLALLIFILGIEIFSGSILWISIFLVQIFSVIIGLTVNYSLMQYSLPKVNVYFSNKKDTIPNAWLIKLNKDNIKIRTPDKTLIIERAHVVRLEFVDADQKREVKRSIVPFIVWLPWLLMLYLLWENKFWLAIIFGLVIPAILFAIGAWLFPISRQDMVVSQNKESALDGLKKYIDSIPMTANIVSVIGLVFIIIGTVGAWHHNTWLTILFGIVFTFIDWALLQVFRPSAIR